MTGSWRMGLIGVAVLACLFLAGLTDVYSRFPPSIANTIASLRTGQLSRLDRAALERGYYEDLQRVNRFNGQLWEVYMNRPSDWLDVRGSGLMRFTGDFVQQELLPSSVFHNNWGDVSTNQWGMRDRDYTREKGPGVYRIAFFGASLTWGWGVQDDETYEALLEKRLNETLSADSGLVYEVLNFAVPNYSPLQQMVAVEKSLEFEPDLIVLAAHRREIARASEYLVDVQQKDIEIPYAPLVEFLDDAGIDSGTSETAANRSLEPFQQDILRWTYARIVELSQASGAVPVMLMFDEQAGIADKGDMDITIGIARDAGLTVLNLEDVYGGYDPVDIHLAEWDRHPNAVGHRLIAEHSYAALTAPDSPVIPIGAGREIHDPRVVDQ